MTRPELQKLTVPVSLSFTVSAEPHVLLVRWQLVNQSDATIFVYDRPTSWTQNGLIDDSQAPYRFIRDQRLRLLVGSPPLPRVSRVTTHKVPQCTAVGAGEGLTRELRVEAPVHEHSSYWSRGAVALMTDEESAKRLEPASIDMVDLLVDYVVDQPGLARRDALAGAVDFNYAVLTHLASTRAHASVAVATVAGFRRRDIESRVNLPGEEPEPLNDVGVDA